jgi:hypothetical protein
MPAAAGTIDIVWSAYRSVLSSKRLSYLSAPITSGKRAMEAAAAGVSKGEIIRTNIEAGTGLAREIAGTCGGPIVAPTIFDANVQKWSQADYMQMWLGMIEENVGDVYMSPDWAFSNGCAEEYLKVINMGMGFGKRSDIIARRPDSKVIHLHDGMEEIVNALHVMHDRKIKADVLASVFLGLYTAYRVWCTHDISRDELPKHYNPEIMGGIDEWKVRYLVETTARLLRHDYGWNGSLSMQSDKGALRTIMAWPEGVVFDVIEEKKPDA